MLAIGNRVGTTQQGEVEEAFTKLHITGQKLPSILIYLQSKCIHTSQKAEKDLPSRQFKSCVRLCQ